MQQLQYSLDPLILITRREIMHFYLENEFEMRTLALIISAREYI